MGMVVNWNKYRSQMSEKEKKLEDFHLWINSLVYEANQGTQWAIDLIKLTKAQLVIATAKKEEGE